MKGINFVVSLGLLFITTQGFSQDTVAISRKDVLEKAANGNLQVEISQYNFEAARADYRQSNSLFLPNISVSHTGISTTNPLMAFGSKLNQEILTASDFNPALLNNPEKTKNFATRIDVMQPILNVDGLKERQAAKSKSEALELQSERTKEYLVLDATKAYIQLQLAYKTVEVLEKANTAGLANLKLVEDYFAQGLLQETDVLAIKVRISEIENQLQYARSSVLNASDYLFFIFNEKSDSKIFKPAEELSDTISSDVPAVSISESRKDLLAMEKSLNAREKMLQSGKLKFIPRLNAFGSYELYDSQLFQMGASGYIIGAQLKWDLFDGYKSIANMDNAKANLRKGQAEVEQYKAKSILEFNQTSRQLKDAENKVNLTNAAFRQTQEAYRIKLNRFEQGLEKTNDLLFSESQMLTKELEHLQAIYEYNYTKQYLQFLTK